MLQAYVYICTVVFTAPMNDMTHAISLLILPYLNQLLFDKHFDETRSSAGQQRSKKKFLHTYCAASWSYQSFFIHQLMQKWIVLKKEY
jgi:hypothetical protein